MEYQIYVDGTLGGGEMAFWNPVNVQNTFADPVLVPPGLVNTYPSMPDYQMTSGGVLSCPAPYNYLTSPNVIPKQREAGVLGITPSLDGSGKTINASIWEAAFPLFDMTGGTNPFGIADAMIGTAFGGRFTMPTASPGTVTTMRYFLRKFTVKIRWTDGALPVNLIGRALQIGGSEYHYNFGGTVDSAAFGSRDLINTHGYSSEGKAYYPDDRIRWTLTDGGAIGTYYGLMGIAVGYTYAPTGLYRWGLFDPTGADNGPFFPSTAGGGDQNIALYTNHTEQIVDEGNGAPLDYTFSQWETIGGAAHTPGWSIDYSTAWNLATGMLSCPVPPLYTFDYRQYGLIQVYEDIALPPFQGANGGPTPPRLVPGTVTLTGSNGKVYTGVTGTPIAAIPNGSLLNDLRAAPGATTPYPQITDLPMLSASTYPAVSTISREPEVVLPGDGSLYKVVYTGKTATDLTGLALDTVLIIDGKTSYSPLKGTEMFPFEGGEVITQYYDVAWMATDRSGRSGTGRIWIHEDRTATLVIVPGGKKTGGGLDYAQDPAGEPWLTNGLASEVDQWTSGNMEASFGFRQIIPEGGASPSRQIMSDHEHLLALVDASGTVNLWQATDLLTWSKLGIIDNAAPDHNPYAAVCLRRAPDDSLHAWLVSTGGTIYKRLSQDGGATWDALTTPTSLPQIWPERPDFRFTGNEWMALLPLTNGNLELYTSTDGDTWTDAVTVYP